MTFTLVITDFNIYVLVPYQILIMYKVDIYFIYYYFDSLFLKYLKFCSGNCIGGLFFFWGGGVFLHNIPYTCKDNSL